MLGLGLNPLRRRFLDRYAALKRLRPQLFSGGQQGLIFVPQPVLLGNRRLYKLSDFTDPVTADGDPVGGGQEVSGNGNHLTQSVSADRPTYGTDGSLHWLGFDGAGDLIGAPSIDLNGNSWTLVVAYEATGDNFLLLHDGPPPAPWVGIGQRGSTLTALAGPDTSQISLYVDGVESQATTRGEQWDLLAGKHVARVEFSASNTFVPSFGYFDSTFTGVDKVFGAVLVKNSSPHVEEAEQYLADLAGVTL